MGWRFVTWANHDLCTRNMLATLAVVEEEELADRITVVSRDGTVLYDNERADRRGATVISIGAAGIGPLRITEHGGKRQEETFTDLVAPAAGIILGQRGRGVPAVVLRGIAFEPSDEGVSAMLRHQP
ncbi:zeta toxin family protein [Streptomyces misionensis]|uniref:zeta toxin family protein n=1 Tax=Streptomyces misionensis TaxID=67331 RepID=UPI0009A12138|nr:coenzyme F420-0:L-glutamate ligase [Streptomyces misionensis]